MSGSNIQDVLFPLCHSRPAEGATAASAEGGSAAPEGASASAAEAPASAIESPKPVERAVEARSTDDAMASMVRVLCFYDTFLLNGTFACGGCMLLVCYFTQWCTLVRNRNARKLAHNASMILCFMFVVWYLVGGGRVCGLIFDGWGFI